jgi:hypothetical protein
MRIDCFVLSAGSAYSKIQSNVGRISAGRQFETKRFASRDYLCCESVVKNSSSRAAVVDDLSPVGNVLADTLRWIPYVGNVPADTGLENILGAFRCGADMGAEVFGTFRCGL